MHTVPIAVVMVSVGVSIAPIGRSITAEYTRYRLKMGISTLEQKPQRLLCTCRCALNRIYTLLFFFVCALTIDFLLFLFRSRLLESNMRLQLNRGCVTKRIFSFRHL